MPMVVVSAEEFAVYEDEILRILALDGYDGPVMYAEVCEDL